MRELVPLIQAYSDLEMNEKFIHLNTREKKISKLFFYIKEGKVTTDVQAKNILKLNSNDDVKLWRIKKQLKEFTYTGLISSTFNTSSRDSKIINKKNKAVGLHNVGLVLWRSNFKNLSVYYFTKALKIANNFDYTDLSIITLNYLVIYYSVYSFDEKKFNYFRKILLDKKRVEKYEFQVNDYYNRLTILYQKRKTNKNEFIRLLKKSTDQLSSIEPKVDSYLFNKKLYSLISSRYIFERDFDKVLENANIALKYFNNKKFSNDVIYHFNVDKIITYILLNNYSKAEEIINKTKQIIRKDLIHYHKLMYYLAFNYSLSQQYDKLYKVVNEVINMSSLKKMQFYHQRWKIREAYVRFLAEAGKVDFEKIGMEEPTKFRLARFLNEVPIYTRDKRGFNISILVVQMLFYIVRNNYGKVIDRIDALNQYTYKYLRNDETYRSNCFIKMLVKIPTANFHPVRTKLHTRDLEAKLRAREMTVEELMGEVEVIPFHDLWDIILEVLEKNWNNR
jgi:hypothetical protein